MPNELTPIFLISLPRSGSTLLQKILTVHPEIHSVDETWLLLPFAYLQQKEGVKTIYNHKICYRAISNFINTLPNKNSDYYDLLRKFVISLYEKTVNDDRVKYFIDKTPRYYLITEFLAEVFPKARFVFLFRNPLEVLSSLLDNWLHDRLQLNRYFIDLYHGPQLLTLGYNKLKNRSITINYKDVVTNPSNEIKRLCTYLEIPYNKSMIIDYKNKILGGRFGDQHGINEYDKISISSLENWKKVLNTRYRKHFSRRYIDYIGDKTLGYFGTSIRELRFEINSITECRSGSFIDLYDHIISKIKRRGNILNISNSLESFFFNGLKYPYM